VDQIKGEDFMTELLTFKENIRKNKRKRISLSEIMKFASPDMSYEAFAQCIQVLIHEEILVPIKASGFNKRSINLPNNFQINKSKLENDYKIMLQGQVQLLSPEIDLDYYFVHSDEWEQDRRYIHMIDDYIKSSVSPFEASMIPEKSYWISEDEKWLSEKGGLQIFEKLKLTEKMNLIREVEPTAFAINNAFQKHEKYKHLIVENKSIFYRLLDILEETSFSTLIYGAGWRIISSMKSFNKQFPFDDKTSEFYYFGDMDHEGLKIWHALSQISEVLPEFALYHRLLEMPSSAGKTNQKSDLEAVAAFCKHVSCKDDSIKLKVINILASGQYIPQEALSLEDLRRVMKGEVDVR